MTFAGKRECSTRLWGSHKLFHFSTLVWKLVKGLIFCFLSFKAQFSSMTVSQFLKIDSRRNLESRINWDLTLLTDCQLTLDNTESYRSTVTIFVGNIVGNMLPDVGVGKVLDFFLLFDVHVVCFSVLK